MGVIAPIFLLTIELITLINPEFWRLRVESRKYIDLFYWVWIAYVGFSFSWKWAGLFMLWTIIPNFFIHEQGSRYLVGSADILRMDATVSIGFIIYYLWNNESFKYLGALFSASIYFAEKKQPTLTKIFFWLIGLIVKNEIIKMEKNWLRLGGDLSEFYIYQGKILIDTLNIRQVLINISSTNAGMSLMLTPEFLIVITVNGQIEAQLLKNVLNEKISVETLIP